MVLRFMLLLSGRRHLLRPPPGTSRGYLRLQLLPSACSPSSDGPTLYQQYKRCLDVQQRRHSSSSSSSSSSSQPSPPSSTTTTTHGLFLWVGTPPNEDDYNEAPNNNSKNTGFHNNNRLLLPIEAASVATIFTPQDVLDAVNTHYTNQQHFVGGMGEDDRGVWFATPMGSKHDTLDYAASIVQEGIALVKEERHGVPFGLYTSGLGTVPSGVTLKDLRLSSLQVSLFAANPSDYQKVTGRPPKDFGKLCGFIVQAVEEGIAVEVGVLEEYKSSARDLALSLGAQQVHVLKG